jgi:hypothetical protein
MDMRSRLQAVGEEDAALIGEDPPPVPNVSCVNKWDESLTQLLIVSLRALSQRTLTAISNLYALVLAASTFWVYLTILSNPTPLQLTGAGMYSIFTIGCLFLRKKP